MIHLRAFGGLDARRGERRLDRLLAQPKRAALLAYLAVATPRGFHTRDTLVALLWPDSDRRHARGSLRKALHFLRRHLGRHVVESRGDEVGLAWDRIACDVSVFDEALERDDWRGAMSAYRGDLLLGLHVTDAPGFERWLDAERLRTRTSAVRAAWQLAESEERAANPIEAVRCGRRAVAIEPLDEAGVRRLMELLDRLGDRAGALRVYDEMTERVRRELEVEPSHESRALAERLRGSAGPTGAAPPPPRPQAIGPPAAPHPAATERRTPDPAAERPSVERGPPRRRRHATFLIGGAGIAVTVASLGALALQGLGPGRAADNPAEPPPPRVLAVLPFENLLPDTDGRPWLVDGLHEQVIHELLRLPSLRVISRASVLPYAESELSVADIADRLDADLVLSGSVRRDGSRLRVTLRLVDPVTGRQEWSEAFDATLDDDFLETQTSIGLRVAQTFAGALPPQGEGWGAGTSTDPEALRAYLRGRYLWKNLGGPPGERAAELFRRAIDIDPDFALAWASLAEGWLASAHFGVAPHVAFPRADSAAIQALARAPDLAEAHIALADTRFHYDWNWEAAESGFQRGISLKPSHATAHWWYAGLLAALGRTDEAAEQMRRARALDPLSPIVDAFGARVLYWGRRHDEAEEAARRAIELAPNHFYALGILGFIHMEKDEPEEAVEAFRRSVEISEKFLPGLAAALARTDRLEEAREIAARLERAAAERYVSPYERALAQLATGDRDRALGLIEEATETRDAELIWIGVDPAWDPLRDEPRFQAVLREMGLEGALARVDPGA